MQTLLYDLRYALRQLRKTPGMAALAVLTLALGIGANTAIFTVTESVLLRPLPYTHSDRLVYIGKGVDQDSFSSTSWLNYRDIHAQSTLLQDAAGYTEDVSVLETPDGSQSIVAPHVTTNLFPMLGEPGLGRWCGHGRARRAHVAHVHRSRGPNWGTAGGSAVGGTVAAKLSCRSGYRRPRGQNQRQDAYCGWRNAPQLPLPRTGRE